MLGASHGHAPRVRKLLQTARAAAEDQGFLGFGTRSIGLDVRLASPRDGNRSDATNYLGGIADVLEDKAHRGKLEHLGDLAVFGLYANDRQIEAVHYSWEAGNSTAYA